MTGTTRSTIVGVFEDRRRAEQAVEDLRRAGFRDDQIGLVARDAGGRVTDVNRRDGGETYAEEGAVAGAIAGAGVGSLVGLGVLAGVVPVIGPAIAAGTLATILMNAAGGADIAGLAGALIGWGIPEEEAEYYESEIKEGRYLVTVRADGRYGEAWAILQRHGGYDRSTAPTTAAAGRSWIG